MQAFGLVLGILGVWRVTHLLHAENGPWDVLERLRLLLSADVWRGLFGCFYCLSLWVALPFSLLLAAGWKERLLFWPALSAGAILLERVSWREGAAPQATYFEEPLPNAAETEDNNDVFLRKDENEPAFDLEGRFGRTR
jgi:hypothetical protein